MSDVLFRLCLNGLPGPCRKATSYQSHGSYFHFERFGALFHRSPRLDGRADALYIQRVRFKDEAPYKVRGVADLAGPHGIIETAQEQARFRRRAGSHRRKIFRDELRRSGVQRKRLAAAFLEPLDDFVVGNNKFIAVFIALDEISKFERIITRNEKRPRRFRSLSMVGIQKQAYRQRNAGDRIAKRQCKGRSSPFALRRTTIEITHLSETIT